MARVICTLPHCSTNVNGIPFEARGEGRMVSAEITEEQAANFARIPGYELLGDKPAAPPVPESTTTPAGAGRGTKRGTATAPTGGQASNPLGGEQPPTHAPEDGNPD